MTGAGGVPPAAAGGAAGAGAERLRVPFTVNSFDADAFGHLAPAALAGWLQEAAGRSAEALGFGVEALGRRGLAWVLTRTRLELDGPVVRGDRLEVETWPSGLDRLVALRDFRLLRDGAEVGRALTTWLAFDLRSRRPVRPDRALPAAFHPQRPHVLPAEAPPLPPLEAPAIDLRFRVRLADIDANLHVTNATYVAWAAEAVDEPTWRGARLAALDVQFLAECHMGAAVRSRSAPEGAGGRRHAVVREEDGKELARLHTRWAPRG